MSSSTHSFTDSFMSHNSFHFLHYCSLPCHAMNSWISVKLMSCLFSCCFISAQFISYPFMSLHHIWYQARSYSIDSGFVNMEPVAKKLHLPLFVKKITNHYHFLYFAYKKITKHYHILYFWMNKITNHYHFLYL